MNKVTKKELIERANEQELRIYRIEQALKQNGIKWVTDEPKLKQLDQSIFNGLEKKWRFAMVSSVGIPFVYDYKPTGKRHFLSDSAAQLMVNIGKVMRIDEYDYDTTNWQNSLIERKELTGSDLCRAMLERGDKYVVCIVSEHEDAVNIDSVIFPKVVYKHYADCFMTTDSNWPYAIPINNQGEPLTATDVGL